MKLQFVGNDHQRIISASDFPDIQDDFRPIVWGPGDIREVPGTVGDRLIQIAHAQFRQVEDEPDEVSKEDLLERAKQLNIKGRSNMSKEELQAAIEKAESSGDDQSASHP